MFSIHSLAGVNDFTWQTALSLAFASKISYQQKDKVEYHARQSWGFTTFEFLDVNATQGFVAARDEVVLIAFRGTDNLADWIGNLNIEPLPRNYGRVHRGFAEAFDAVEPKVREFLSRAATPSSRIWLTGHSLGGALASICAAELMESAQIAGIYTFGQPRVGDAEFQETIRAHFESKFFRFVNDHDIVTRIPPGFKHVGSLIHFDAYGVRRGAKEEAGVASLEPNALSEEEFGELQGQINFVRARFPMHGLTAEESSFEASVEGVIPGLSDHAIDRYIAVIRRYTGTKYFDPVIEAGLLKSSAAGLKPLVAENLQSAEAGDLLYGALVETINPDWQPPPTLVVNSKIGTILSVQGNLRTLEALRIDPDIVSVVASRDAGLPELSTSVPFVRGDEAHRPPISEQGDLAIVGIIDTGIDVLHEAFLDNAGNSRILAIWNQRNKTGPTPHAVDPACFRQKSGTLILQAEIQRMIDDYKTSGIQPAYDLRDPDGHGTHVASIAAGRAVGSCPSGMAPDARIVVVIADLVTRPGDPPSIGYSASHHAALDFLKSVAAGGSVVIEARLPIVINVSLGMNAGAHDGSSPLERGFDNITGGGRDAGIAVVKSAGNERGTGGHTMEQAPVIGITDVKWITQPQSQLQDLHLEDYFEVWYSSFDDLHFTLVDPAGNRSPTVDGANLDEDTLLGGNFCSMRLKKSHRDNGAGQLVTKILASQRAIQGGTWTLEIGSYSVKSADLRIDVWVERDNSRAVRFVNDVEEVTLSIPGTAYTVITVAACLTSNPIRLTATSSFGATRIGGAKPDIIAPGENILAAKSNEGDTRATTRNTGTSMAAPHVSGAIALAFSRRQKQSDQTPLCANQIRVGLVQTAEGYCGRHHKGFGYGRLDVVSFLNWVDTIP